MAIEHATTQIVPKPWGSVDLRPWSESGRRGVAIGELWFERADSAAPSPALLLKLLFTKEPLSIQVHPDDAFARSIGLAHGKSEAWYIVSATPDAEVGIGLKQPLTPPQLRTAIEDGSILDLVRWLPVVKDDVIFVPAGTIHAIGTGLVVAEVQQRSDATFRLHDHGRGRELHVDDAVAAAHTRPADGQCAPQRLTDARTVLVAGPHFVLERFELWPESTWELHAEHETWLLVLEGQARVESVDLLVGEAIFLDADRAAIKVASGSLKGLLAYVGSEPSPDLLHNIDWQNAGSPVHPVEARP
jgi:mannose-6-phosphate isomerase